MMAFTKPYQIAAACAALALISAPVHAREAAPAPAAQPEQGADSRTLSDAESYVRMPSLQTPVQDRLRMLGMLQVSLALDAPRARTRSLIRDRELWLRDAYNETVLLYAARLYRWGQVPDADLIAQLLQEDTDRLLGEGRATVVLDTVIIHPS